MDSQASECYKQQVLVRGLSPRHREAMRLVAQGKSIPSVAKELGYSVNRLYQISRSPLWQRELAKLVASLDQSVVAAAAQATYDVTAGLRDLHPIAVETYQDLMEQETYPAIRLQAANEVLNRTGIITPTVTHTITATKTYEEQLAQVKVDYTRVANGPSPIEVIGGTELLEEPEDD